MDLACLASKLRHKRSAISLHSIRSMGVYHAMLGVRRLAWALAAINAARVAAFVTEGISQTQTKLTYKAWTTSEYISDFLHFLKHLCLFMLRFELLSLTQQPLLQASIARPTRSGGKETQSS